MNTNGTVGGDRTEALYAAGKARNIEEPLTREAVEKPEVGEVTIALKGLGYSIEEICAYLLLTPPRVYQLIGDAGILTEEERSEQLLAAGETRKIDGAATKAAIEMEDREQAMIALKGLGYSLENIGTFFKRTRERVRQIIGDSDRARPVVKETATSDDLARQVWRAANNDMAWWGTNGRLDKDKIVTMFLNHQYTWDSARENAKYVGASKIDVILRVTFNVKPTHEAKIKWFKGKIAKGHSKTEILKIINEGQTLTIPPHTFLRIWRELGLNIRIRTPA